MEVGVFGECLRTAPGFPLHESSFLVAVVPWTDWIARVVWPSLAVWSRPCCGAEFGEWLDFLAIVCPPTELGPFGACASDTEQVAWFMTGSWLVTILKRVIALTA